MTQVAAVFARVLIAICVGLLPRTVLGTSLFGVALRTVRAIHRSEHVDVVALDPMACGTGVGTALAGSYLALGFDSMLAGVLLLGVIALASTLRWRVRCTRTVTEVARTFLGLAWHRRIYDGRAQLAETGWGEASDPAAIEVVVGTQRVCPFASTSHSARSSSWRSPIATHDAKPSRARDFRR